MLWTRAQLKQEAKARLTKFYWWAVLISFIVTIFTGGGGGGGSSYNSYSDADDIQSLASTDGWNSMISNIDIAIIYLVCGIILLVFIIGGLYMAFVGNMLYINENRFYLCSREYKASLGEIIYAFKTGYYLRSVKTMFMIDLKVFLWSLLLVIPGIIKSYEYRMIPMLIAENPQLETERAFELSREMMRGQKWDTFVLDLSFILWSLLGLLTCGIGMFFIRPYIKATEIELYTVLKNSIKQRGITNDFELSGFSNNK